jgi:hypothetical protein
MSTSSDINNLMIGPGIADLISASWWTRGHWRADHTPAPLGPCLRADCITRTCVMTAEERLVLLKR